MCVCVCRMCAAVMVELEGETDPLQIAMKELKYVHLYLSKRLSILNEKYLIIMYTVFQKKTKPLYFCNVWFLLTDFNNFSLLQSEVINAHIWTKICHIVASSHSARDFHVAAYFPCLLWVRCVP